MELDEIIAALPRLSADERGRLMQAMRALPASGGALGAPEPFTRREKAPVRGSEGDVELCLAAISDVLRKRGLEFASPFVLRKHPGFGSFATKVPHVMALLRKATTSRVELSYLVELSVGLLYEDLTRMGATAVSSRLIINHFHRVPSVLNKAFPGYLAAGLLGRVIKRTSANYEKRKK